MPQYRAIEVTDTLVSRMVEVIVGACDPEQIILFGSRATGNPKSCSDVDLLIVDSRPFDGGRDRFEEMTRIRGLLSRFAVPVDILLYSRDEVEEWRDSINHVIARALREGKVLYERP